MNTKEAVEDPFHHLHDEGYTRALEAPVLGCDGMVAMGGRAVESLAGPWRFTLDLFDEGLRQRWFATEPAPATAWVVPRDYDAGAGATLEVPSCWTTVKPEWRHYEGSAWYSRQIEWQADPERPRCVLRAGAANYLARVFLNGRFLGVHRGASTPFFVELTDHLRPGPNRLQIQVDSTRRPQQVPMNHFDWFNDGGLYREVGLLHLPAVFIRDAALQLQPGSDFSRLAFDMQLSEGVEGVAWVRVPELGVAVDVPVRGGYARACIKAQPELWSPANPRRYEVVFGFGADEVRESIGFREIRTQGQQLLLNGKPLFLRGICVHEDDDHTGKCSSVESASRMLADAKELGCNFLRLSHYPHHERVAELADAAGILLWEEIPVYWAIDFSNPQTFEDARNQLRELVRRDRNRASVILWGVGNENADTDARYDFMRALAHAAKEQDHTRLVGAACLINRERFRIEDRLAEHLDVVGINEYFGWYEPGFDGLDRLLTNSSPDKPVLISETGADALAGHHGSARELFTEECQANFYREQIARIARTPYLCGMTPWLLYDFRSERRQTVFNRGYNRKGLIAQDKSTRKRAFDVLARFYHSFQTG